MKLSICILTIDRYDMAKACIEEAINNCGVPEVEVLICNNGSTDHRVAPWCEYLVNNYGGYFRNNSRNEGVGRAFNQLLLRSTGEYIALLGNDNKMPANWGATAIEWNRKLQRPGLVAFETAIPPPPVTTYDGVTAHFLSAGHDKVFGITTFRRTLLSAVGYFCEDFEVYGLEDSDLNNRVNLAGFKSFYIPGQKVDHLDLDVGANTEYRRMKDESLGKNQNILGRRMANYGHFDQGIYVAPPQMKEPI